MLVRGEVHGNDNHFVGRQGIVNLLAVEPQGLDSASNDAVAVATLYSVYPCGRYSFRPRLGFRLYQTVLGAGHAFNRLTGRELFVLLANDTTRCPQRFPLFFLHVISDMANEVRNAKETADAAQVLQADVSTVTTLANQAQHVLLGSYKEELQSRPSASWILS